MGSGHQGGGGCPDGHSEVSPASSSASAPTPARRCEIQTRAASGQREQVGPSSSIMADVAANVLETRMVESAAVDGPIRRRHVVQHLSAGASMPLQSCTRARPSVLSEEASRRREEQTRLLDPVVTSTNGSPMRSQGDKSLSPLDMETSPRSRTDNPTDVTEESPVVRIGGWDLRIAAAGPTDRQLSFSLEDHAETEEDCGNDVVQAGAGPTLHGEMTPPCTRDGGWFMVSLSAENQERTTPA